MNLLMSYQLSFDNQLDYYFMHDCSNLFETFSFICEIRNGVYEKTEEFG